MSRNQPELKLMATLQTAGVTSAAVQPPGSGSELLHSTPSRGSATRRDSDSSPVVHPSPSVAAAAGAGAGAGVIAGAGAAAVAAGSAGTTTDKATSSGGYTEMLQSETSEQDQQESDQQEDADEGGAELEAGEGDYDLQDEYEEEDRLIAQGGLGIPIDEVSYKSSFGFRFGSLEGRCICERVRDGEVPKVYWYGTGWCDAQETIPHPSDHFPALAI